MSRRNFFCYHQKANLQNNKILKKTYLCFTFRIIFSTLKTPIQGQTHQDKRMTNGVSIINFTTRVYTSDISLSFSLLKKWDLFEINTQTIKICIKGNQFTMGYTSALAQRSPNSRQNCQCALVSILPCLLTDENNKKDRKSTNLIAIAEAWVSNSKLQKFILCFVC